MPDERLRALLDLLDARNLAPLDRAWRAEPEDPLAFVRAYAETGTPRGPVRLTFSLDDPRHGPLTATVPGRIALAWDPLRGTWALAEAAILPGPIICPAWVVAGMRVLDGGAAALLVGIDGATVRISVEDEEPATVRLLP